jgi:hypothetical protein
LERYNGFDIDGRRLRLDWDIGVDRKNEIIHKTRESPRRGFDDK